MIQFKNLIAKVGEIEVKGQTVAGYFAEFNSLDHDGDIILPGAMDKSIEERGPNGSNQIMHLLQHDSWRPLGKPNVLRSDSKGLYFETNMPDTTIGIDTIKLYAAGVYNEHSIGYQVLQWEMKYDEAKDEQIRLLKEIKLWEGSTVTWGANENTPFTGFKDLAVKNKPEMIDRLAERMEKLQKALADNKFSQDTITQIQYELQVVTKIIKSLDRNEEPIITPKDRFKPTHEQLVKQFFEKFNENLL